MASRFVLVVLVVIFPKRLAIFMHTFLSENSKIRIKTPAPEIVYSGAEWLTQPSCNQC